MPNVAKKTKTRNHYSYIVTFWTIFDKTNIKLKAAIIYIYMKYLKSFIVMQNSDKSGKVEK